MQPSFYFTKNNNSKREKCAIAIGADGQTLEPKINRFDAAAAKKHFTNGGGVTSLSVKYEVSLKAMKSVLDAHGIDYSQPMRNNSFCYSDPANIERIEDFKTFLTGSGFTVKSTTRGESLFVAFRDESKRMYARIRNGKIEMDGGLPNIFRRFLGAK